MKFNKTAYFIPIKTNNNTNTKDYSLVFDKHTISIDFIFEGFWENESALFVREGGEMGLYIESPNLVKFKWKNKENENQQISGHIENMNKIHNITINLDVDVELYLDGVLIDKLNKGNIKDYSKNRLIIGAETPYNQVNEKWFLGDINGFSLYQNLVEIPEKNTYINLDFVNNSKFKTFDKSGSGNHGVFYENPQYVKHSITEYNKLGPKQKIL